MARPHKAGLDYFPFDIDFFQDEKIVCIAGEFGIKGELVAIRLLCAIYKKGYFVEWNEQQKYKLSKEMQGVSAGLIEQIVRRLAKWGFFDETLLDSAGILTSRGIQRRYFEARKRLRRIDLDSVNPAYVLIPEIINAEKTPVSSEETTISSSKNATKEIKSNEIKREDKSSQKSGEEEEDMKKRIEKYKKNEKWIGDIAEKHGVDPEEVPALLEAFHLDMRCKKLQVRNLPYFFDNWLAIYKQKQTPDKNSGSTVDGKKSTTKSKETEKSFEADLARLDQQIKQRDEAYAEMQKKAVKPAEYIRRLGYDPAKVGMQHVCDPEWRAKNPPTLPV